MAGTRGSISRLLAQYRGSGNGTRRPVCLFRWIDRKALLFRITDNPRSSPREHQNGDLGI
jgi:hypothetical protein